MAKTGIKIEVSNTTFAGVPKVNENSILFLFSAFPSKLKTGALEGVRSAEEFKTKLLLSQMGLTKDEESAIKQVEDYFNPTPTISNNGKLLWVYIVSYNVLFHEDMGGNPSTISAHDLSAVFEQVIRETVADGFEYRPRQLLVSTVPSLHNYYPNTGEIPTIEAAQLTITNLYKDGFSMVAITSSAIGGLSTIAYEGDSIDPESPLEATPFVADCVVADGVDEVVAITKAGGYLITKSVGSSIGDASFDSFASKMYLVTNNNSGEAGDPIDVSELSSTVVESLGETQYLFCRTRPPRNGLWWNDGATRAGSDTALSTLEAGRTIASIVDDLREFFTAYINTRVPVADNGDIQPTYKQVVLDSAFAQVIQPYIDNGDISNARIELKALNNNMVESRTWEIKVSILPAPTLRWIDGFVFYVKSLE